MTTMTTTIVVSSGGDNNKGGSNNSNSRGNLTFILKWPTPSAGEISQLTA
jgi:hypothetical protein